MKDSRYTVVAGACLTQFTVIGLLFSYGVFFASFEAEFGWSRTMLSAAASLAFFMMGTLAMLAGRLNDRFGPRRVLAVSGLIYGLGYALLSQISAPWHLFAIFGTALAIGLSTHDVVTLSTIARWFRARRGIMSGVIKVGTAFGQITLPPIAAALILWLGWQQALVVIGLVAAGLLLIAALLMSAPAQSAAQSKAPETGASFAVARASRIFWTLCAIQFLFFSALMTVPTHLAVHGMDLGMSAPRAAALLSVIGAASIAGRLTVGFAVDRIGGKNAYLLCFAFLLTSLAGLVFITGHTALFAIIAIYGFAHGGLFTVVSPAVAEYFGMKAHGAIFGTVLFFGTIGGSLGPILAGMVFDATGSYGPAFTTLTIGVAIGLALVMSLPRPLAE